MNIIINRPGCNNYFWAARFTRSGAIFYLLNFLDILARFR